ncbi:SDR family NAD(P)-dependent oxidoreductase [Chloroflexota bacterium]
MRFKDKVVIITGAGSGFGRAGAMAFAREGAKVVVVDINDQNGEETVSLVKKAGGEASYVHVDVGVVDDDKRMIETAVKTYGKLNIFWHNAGNAGPGRVEDTTEEDFDLTMDIHVKGGFFGAKYAIPELIKSGGGSILFTNSASGLKPSQGSTAYSVAKAGQVMMTRCLAIQFAKHNIRVNAIAAGVAQTGLSPAFRGRNPQIPDEVQIKRLLDATPLGCMVDTEDIAQAALYLASDEACHVTGVVLPVDAGIAAI